MIKRRGFPAGGGFRRPSSILLAETWFLSTSEPLTGMPYVEPTADYVTVVAKRSLLSQTEVGSSSSATVRA